MILQGKQKSIVLEAKGQKQKIFKQEESNHCAPVNQVEQRHRTGHWKAV